MYPLLSKPVTTITEADLQALIDDKQPEGIQVDYKRTTYANTDVKKLELLKDVSAFANTRGGDVILGIKEENLLPVELVGLECDADQEIRRLNELVQRWTEPKIDLHCHAVQLASGKCCIILRANESLISPHRVILNNEPGQFYSRQSNQNLPMDTVQLRRAFTLSETVNDRIRQFREQRVDILTRGWVGNYVLNDASIVMHLVPVGSYLERYRINIKELISTNDCPPPAMWTGLGWEKRPNLDGLLSYRLKESNTLRSYTQLFVDGRIEALMTGIATHQPDSAKVLEAVVYEKCFLHALKHFLQSYKRLSILPPIWCMMSMLNVQHATVLRRDSSSPGDTLIDRQTLLLPEVLIQDPDQTSEQILRPVFDMIWNASGHQGDPYFNDKGEFTRY